MVTFPPYAWKHFPSITPWSREAIGGFIGCTLATAANASTAWPAANLAIMVPFSTWEPLLIKEVFWYNGATTGGNIDIGIYDRTAVNRLASLGGVARFGSASIQNTSTTWTDYALPPGDYYMALSHDATNNMFGPSATVAGTLAAAGVLEAPTAYPLPATVVPVATTRVLLPHFGLLLGSVAI